MSKIPRNLIKKTNFLKLLKKINLEQIIENYKIINIQLFDLNIFIIYILNY